MKMLELLSMGTHVKYPYQEFHEYRAQVLLLVLSQSGIQLIPVTYRYHGFPRGAIC
jgi:hypothetical protein